MGPQQRRPRPNLACSAIGWMDHLILLYTIYAANERNLRKAAYIPVKAEEKEWFLTRAAHVADSRCKKYMGQALDCKWKDMRCTLLTKIRKLIFLPYA
jgi:hypothetical protein